MFEERIISFL